MDLFLIIGVALGFITVIVGTTLKAGSPLLLLNPAAAVIIFVGTFAAVMNAFPRKEFMDIPKIVGATFSDKAEDNPVEIINQIAEMSQTARKDGLLSLEGTMQNMENRLMKKGLGMVVDGIEQEYIREVLNIEIESMEDRHRAAASVFSQAGSYAPTLGVLGAVIGLMGALQSLDDTSKLGGLISAAFVATIYGIFTGYVICHPIANRLKRKSHEEATTMRIIVEGILSIQAGENPRSIEIKLLGMLPPKERTASEEEGGGE
jgi:chemotaxis protein MotA